MASTNTHFQPAPLLGFPALGYNIVQKDLDHLDRIQNVHLTHHINDIILIRPNEQEVGSSLEALERHVWSKTHVFRGQEVNL